MKPAAKAVRRFRDMSLLPLLARRSRRDVPRRRLILAGLSALLLALPSYAQPSAPTFTESEMTSDSGQALIQWESGRTVTLEMADNGAFDNARALYRGDYDSYFISGLKDGVYHLRLSDDAGQTSGPAQLVVEHQSLTRAIWLMIVGAIISLAIVATIWRGARS